MNTLSPLDDPLGPPPLEPAAVRRRARALRRRRQRWLSAGVAGGAVVVALVVALGRPDSVQVQTRNSPAATPPSACEPDYEVARSFLIMSGATPDDNEVLVGAAQEILESHEFAGALHARLDVDIAERLTVDAVATAISVSRPPSSAVMKVAVQAPDLADAEQLSAEVLPTLTAIMESGQRTLPIEDRIPGPIVQELFTRPMITQERC